MFMSVIILPDNGLEALSASTITSPNRVVTRQNGSDALRRSIIPISESTS